eukprot:12876526-Alexandrium_andersonii.AAC.1
MIAWPRGAATHWWKCQGQEFVWQQRLRPLWRLSGSVMARAVGVVGALVLSWWQWCLWPTVLVIVGCSWPYA